MSLDFGVHLASTAPLVSIKKRLQHVAVHHFNVSAGLFDLLMPVERFFNEVTGIWCNYSNQLRAISETSSVLFPFGRQIKVF